MTDEVSKEVCQLAVRVSAPMLRALMEALKNGNKKAVKKIFDKIKEPPKGKMSVKQLVRKDQGVQSTELGSDDVRLFKKCADKYGVDFAIVKDKSEDPPVYNLFFKGKDADAVLAAMKDFGNAEMKKSAKAKKRESVLEKLAHFKDIVAKTPRKAKEKRKEQAR